MQLSRKELDEFKQIYKDEYGKDLTDDQAYDLALPLLQLFSVICRPLPPGHKCKACTQEEK